VNGAVVGAGQRGKSGQANGKFHAQGPHPN
jgi:hypothetical protein